MSETLQFGRLLTAMVTPFGADGALDRGAVGGLATHLVDRLRNDALVVNGTTGESPTTTDAEKSQIIAATVEAVGDRVPVLAGVGTNSTAHTVELAKRAADAGANGLLVVTPYYSKPPQSGIIAHFEAVADAVDLPIMIYDIPHRSGVPITSDTLITLAEHERIIAVKDAKGDLIESSKVIGATSLAYYSGDDAMTLPLMSIGGVGVVGTSTHFTGALVADMIAAFVAGDNARALELHRRAHPVFTGVFATQGCSMVKSGLAAQGRGVGGLRLPQVAPTPEQGEVFTGQLRDCGLL